MPISLKRKAERDSQRAARRYRLEAGIEGAFAGGFEADLLAGGAATGSDISEKAPGVKGIGLDTDRLFPEIVIKNIPIQGLYATGFEDDR